MHRRIILFAAAALLLAGSPAWADPPFGSFGGQVNGGNAGAGQMALHGWALDDDGVAAVDILVDGHTVGRAAYGRARPGVTAQFPGFPDSAAPGFAFELDTSQFLNGLHEVTARVLSATGEVRLLQTRTIQFLNLTHNLVPFGRIDLPNTNVELLGNCDLSDPNRRYSVVSGYALDVGVETGDQGVGYVELMIDGVIFANSLSDCTFDPDRGGLTDCYGLRRFDVERIFPYLEDSPISGFRFVLDVGALIDFGYNPGKHVLTVRSGDISGQVADIDEINAFFSCDDFVGNEASFGYIGLPRQGLVYGGAVVARGWALDWDGIRNVRIYIDGELYGLARRSLPRPTVSLQYPGYPDSAAPGWTIAIDTTRLSNGPHDIQVVVRDGATPFVDTLIGERTITVFNP